MAGNPKALESGELAAWIWALGDWEWPLTL